MLHELGELSQWLCHNYSTINIVLNIIIIIIIISSSSSSGGSTVGFNVPPNTL